MNPCAELEPLLAAHASGELSGEEAARVTAHLQGCAACRADHAALVEVLGLARLPPVSQLEERALAPLVEQTRAAWTRRAQRSRWLATGGLAAAAAALLLVLGLASRVPFGARHHVAPVTPSATETSDTTEALVDDELGDDPLELAADDSTDALADPELSPVVFSEEGDEP